MCLIMTMIAAAVTGVIWFVQRKHGVASKSLFTLFLAFLSAALMWCVDGIASIAEGEPFFTISGEDAILGAIIIVLGFFVFGLLSVLEKTRKNSK
ncbi:MAG: hypothetical protein K2M99_07950 [Treponemataceae bacterium]|nr:hypothetical protein [Treponemataceae bacterium]